MTQRTAGRAQLNGARRPLRWLLVAATLGVCLPAQAGLFDDDEARAQIKKVAAQLAELAGNVDTLSRNQLGFAEQLEALRTELARLRGQVEVLAHDLENSQKRQQDFYVDLDNRLRNLETAAQTPSAPVAAADPQAAAGNETGDYEKAVTALKAGKYKEAAAAFDQFIVQFPNSSLTGSAHYWGAYAHGQLKAVLKAAAMLGKFAAAWPDDERAPEALESQADYLLAAKDTKGAVSVLDLLVRKYPKSEAGKRAKQRLQKR